jgi:hybrid polyketide synthase/nonribosomal peptide synthetase FtdB
VHAAAVDVGDGPALAAFMRELRARERRPVRGLVHAAGIAPLARIEHLREADLFDAMRAKVDGSVHLHALLEREPLDFVVYFSSFASLMDSPRLAHYAAGNAFLDAFAHYQRARGANVVAINWGPWGEVGMVSRGPAALRAGPLISPEAGILAMERILASGRAQTGVWPVELDALDERPRAEPDARPHETRATAESRIAAHLGSVLRVPSDSFAVNQPLEELGLDSLMAAELRNRVCADFGIELPLMAVLAAPTITDIAALVRQTQSPMGAPAPLA